MFAFDSYIWRKTSVERTNHVARQFTSEIGDARKHFPSVVRVSWRSARRGCRWKCCASNKPARALQRSPAYQPKVIHFLRSLCTMVFQVMLVSLIRVAIDNNPTKASKTNPCN